MSDLKPVGKKKEHDGIFLIKLLGQYGKMARVGVCLLARSTLFLFVGLRVVLYVQTEQRHHPPVTCSSSLSNGDVGANTTSRSPLACPYLHSGFTDRPSMWRAPNFTYSYCDWCYRFTGWLLNHLGLPLNTSIAVVLKRVMKRY